MAIRISSHPVAQKLCSLWGGAITATSANESGCLPLENATQLITLLGDRVDYVLDGGPVSGGQGSTMLEIIHDEVQIVRKGVIPEKEIFQILAKNR